MVSEENFRACGPPIVHFNRAFARIVAFCGADIGDFVPVGRPCGLANPRRLIGSGDFHLLSPVSSHNPLFAAIVEALEGNMGPVRRYSPCSTVVCEFTGSTSENRNGPQAEFAR